MTTNYINTRNPWLRLFLFVTVLTVLWTPARSAMAAERFPVRGFHIDLRIQVMKMPALKNFAYTLSKNGINTLIMEWEGTYPYKQHPLIANRYSYTREEIRSFITYCSSIGIDVIPLQQSFGHVEYILRHQRYAELREDQKDYSQVNPLKEELAKKLFTELYKDLISTHSSPYIHIGGDETYLLGHSPESKKKAELVGTGRLYGDYLKMLCDIVISLDKRPVVWADIALKYPEALPLLPKETVFVDWNYGWDLNRFGDHQKLTEQGFEIWGAPAIRSGPDNYYLTDWKKHFHNIRDFIPSAQKLGYKGMVMTSWSTSGIYSPVFESGSDITELYPVRRVYPITGFRILIEAYFAALKTGGPLDVETFIQGYGTDRFGFNHEQSSMFLKVMTLTAFEINQGKISPAGADINKVVDSAAFVRETLHRLKPVRNKQEYEHFLLMADIRLRYLQFKHIEIQVNAETFAAEQLPTVLAGLRRLQKQRPDKRYLRLNKATFYSEELQEELLLMNGGIDRLYKRLNKVTTKN
ncbi:beta-N-acetylhexosaminidase [Arcticibacter sp.]|uniref:beta-N-acetylhexosaminidase n=1 Tax=Arcticibacter sp. TaxID=1872630 RepID=UPI00388ED3E4